MLEITNSLSIAAAMLTDATTALMSALLSPLSTNYYLLAALFHSTWELVAGALGSMLLGSILVKSVEAVAHARGRKDVKHGVLGILAVLVFLQQIILTHYLDHRYCWRGGPGVGCSWTASFASVILMPVVAVPLTGIVVVVSRWMAGMAEEGGETGLTGVDDGMVAEEGAAKRNSAKEVKV